MSGHIEAKANVMFDIISLDPALKACMDVVVFDGNKISNSHIEHFERLVGEPLRIMAINGVVTHDEHFVFQGAPRTFTYRLEVKDIKPRMIGACLRRWYREKKSA